MPIFSKLIRKEATVPEFDMYHFTSPIQMEFIREDGYINMTNSNLKIDDAALHSEPMYRNGEIIGEPLSRCRGRPQFFHSTTPAIPAWATLADVVPFWPSPDMPNVSHAD